MLVLSSYIRRDDLPPNTKKRKGTFRSLCAFGRVAFHFHGRIPPCLSNVETILSQKNLFIKSSCALLRLFFAKRDVLSPACFSLRLRLSWRVGVRAAGGTMHRIVQNPVSEHNKNQTNIVGFFCRSVSNVNRIIRLYLQLNTKYLFDDI